MSLVSQIVIGLVCGIALALLAPAAARSVAMLGDLFIAALKAAAPVLVFVLVAASIAGHKRGQPTHIRPILMRYLIGTLGAAVVAVLASFAFPTTLVLSAPAAAGASPGDILAVLRNLLLSAVANPVKALTESNFIGILTWSIGLGMAFRHASLTTRTMLHADTYAISIPLGAAITITVMTLAAAHTLGIQVDMATALLLCVVASLAACGVSSVAGGSLLLIPMALSLFGISADVAMQVVAIGFVISVVQDSAETALNSSTDVLFTAAACPREVALPVATLS